MRLRSLPSCFSSTTTASTKAAISSSTAIGAGAAADMTAERGWLTMQDGLELVDTTGNRLASLPGTRLIRVHDDGSATT